MCSLKFVAVRMNLSNSTAALITQLLRLRLETTHLAVALIFKDWNARIIAKRARRS
jgi:hypothetical protein